jgi:hypothetical protein
MVCFSNQLYHSNISPPMGLAEPDFFADRSGLRGHTYDQKTSTTCGVHSFSSFSQGFASLHAGLSCGRASGALDSPCV